MPEEVRGSYIAAQRSAQIATFVMAIIVALQALIFITYLITLAEAARSLANVLRLFAMLVTIGATVLLASFFWCFGKDRSPFGRRQSLRLAAAGALFLVRMGVDALVFSLASPAVANGTPGLTEHPEVNLQIVTIIVFLGCLAMVMRYGEALKEDSDSIA